MEEKMFGNSIWQLIMIRVTKSLSLVACVPCSQMPHVDTGCVYTNPFKSHSHPYFKDRKILY